MDSCSGEHTTNGNGPRISEREYEKSIVELYSGLPPKPDKRTQEQLRRRELDLTIDYRLGQNFPQERRKTLWSIQQRVERKRGRLMIFWLLRILSHVWLEKRTAGLARYLVDEYARVLTPEELDAFFECDKDRARRV